VSQLFDLFPHHFTVLSTTNTHTWYEHECTAEKQMLQCQIETKCQSIPRSPEQYLQK